ncbi:MAG: dihydroneopterin aldolase [Verrucomicrobiae bacterium]|nr:dihydroneopterin aldolase [Verrucomicrobiae bacterium]
MSDKITICDMAVMTHIGVPEEERAHAQKLLVTVELTLSLRRASKSDDVVDTIDYAQVYQLVHMLAQARPRRLLEHFAQEICDNVLAKHAVKKVEVRLKKFILPDTACVIVQVSRKA